MIVNSKDFNIKVYNHLLKVTTPTANEILNNLDQIVKKHKELTGTSSFFYEDEQYGVHSPTIQRLPKELEKDMQQYLRDDRQIISDREFFRSYLSILAHSANNYDQLRDYLPQEAIPDGLRFFKSTESFHLLDKDHFFKIYNYYKLAGFL